MTTHTPGTGEATESGSRTAVREGQLDRDAGPWTRPEVVEMVEPLDVPVIAESAEAFVEDLDAPHAAAPALLDRFWAAAPGEPEEPEVLNLSGSPDATAPGIPTSHDARSFIEAARTVGGAPGARPIAVDEYARAVIYNGLGHYQAATAAAQRACASDDFALLDGALMELVEAGVRSGSRLSAVAALQRLETRARDSRSPWVQGVTACARALVNEDESAEGDYLQAIERLAGTRARVALARARLLYGEWLRRRGRRIDARAQLTTAHRIFQDVGLGGFADRARREKLATVHTARKRIDSTRLDLTPQESQIALLAANGWTNPEIGERLFISPRTVEWHLRKIFTKLGLSSRRELVTLLPQGAPVAAWT